MLCSKCKIFSIHLPNYDSYICEFGHILCRTCSAKSCNRCTICDGRIIRQTEFRLEGIPKTIFRQTTENCMQMSDADSETKLNIDSDSEENCSRIFEYHDFERFADHNINSLLNDTPEYVATKASSMGYNILPDSPIKLPSRDDLHYQIKNKTGANADNVRPKRSLCKFRTPSTESIETQYQADGCNDPKEIYMKKIYGDPPQDFDTRQDYFERMAQVNAIHEYYKRPNLLMTTKSSSKIEFKVEPSMSDSNTVIQHLSEFRKATKYTPPSNVSSYKVNDEETMSEPAIITTSKTNLNRKLREASPKRTQVVSYVGKKMNSETMYSEGFGPGPYKVDVGTMMDICLLPSGDSLDIPTEESEKNSSPHKEEEPAIQSPQGNLTEVNQSQKKSHPSLHTLLREKLKTEVYSHFDSAPRPPKNTFMIKGEVGYLQNSPSCPTEAHNMHKVSKLTDAINSEVEKAIKNLTSFPSLPFNGSQRREEIVNQSKNLLRKRIMEEVYSQFGKNDCSTNMAEESSNLSEVHSKERSDTDVKIECSKSESHSPNPDVVSSAEIAEIDTPYITPSHFRGSRTFGMSTESYPKLNPELAILTPSKDSTQKSQSAFYSEAFVQDYNKSSFVFDLTSPKLESKAGTMYSEVENEILEQFQKNVGNISNPSNEKRLDSIPLENEQASKINPLSGDTYESANPPQLLQKSAMIPNVSYPEAGGESSTIPEMKRDFESQIQIDPTNNQNVFYFQQTPHYTFSPLIPQAVKSIGDDPTNFTVKTMARTLVEDYREEPTNSNVNGLLDLNKFIQYIREKFPDITLKSLKSIILNLPGDDPQSEELTELDPRLPPPATFRSDYEEIAIRQEFSEKQATDDLTLGFESSEFPTEISLSTIVTAWRAFYRPPIDVYSEPTPQFKAISRFDTEVSLIDHVHREIKAAAELNLPRSPVVCPISSCSKLIFVSEFSKHIKMDHVKIPVESLTPGRCKNLFLDPRSDDYGINKCHILYLVTDKIRDLGSKEFKDFLPVLVMATKVSLLELVSPSYHSRCKEVLENRQNYLMIWLTGLSPHNLPIQFSLTAWHRFGMRPKCHVVHSGRIYSIRNNQDERSIFRSGHALLLSQNQVRLLTDNGQNMIELQVVVH